MAGGASHMLCPIKLIEQWNVGKIMSSGFFFLNVARFVLYFKMIQCAILKSRECSVLKPGERGIKENNRKEKD